MAGSSQAGGHDVAMNANDTIVAIATAPGAGGVGIVRLSGPAAKRIAETIAGKSLLPRTARHARFLDADGDIIDDGIAVYFMAPASYTGEDVAELQAHGSPVLLRQLVARCIALDMDCAAICRLAAAAMARASDYAADICALCARICEACAKECQSHQHAHCQECAKACAHCARMCREMASA